MGPMEFFHVGELTETVVNLTQILKMFFFSADTQKSHLLKISKIICWKIPWVHKSQNEVNSLVSVLQHGANLWVP